MEEPFKPLLDRDVARVVMAQDHSPTLDLMDEIANYGSNLIPRCLESSDKDLVAAIVVGVLLRQGVSMLDATTALCREGSVTPGWTTSRALVEAWISAAYVLKEDSLNRARHYYTWNLRQQRRWMRRLLVDSKEAQAFQHVWDSLSILSSPSEAKAAEQQDARITELLSRPVYSDIDKAFEKRSQPSHDDWWFRPLGVKNIRGLAKAVDQLPTFDLIYGRASQVVHSTSYETGITIGDGEISLLPMRHERDFAFLAGLTTTIAPSFYRLMIATYRAGEEANLRRKYTEEWQERYLAMHAGMRKE